MIDERLHHGINSIEGVLGVLVQRCDRALKCGAGGFGEGQGLGRVDGCDGFAEDEMDDALGHEYGPGVAGK